jgi:hypothetical protein
MHWLREVEATRRIDVNSPRNGASVQLMNAAPTGLLVFLIAFHSSFAADSPPPEIRLTGLVSRDGKDLAVLEIKNGRRIESSLLAAGDHSDAMSVVDIDRAAGAVTIQQQGKELRLTLPVQAKGGERVLNLHGVRLETVLEIYQHLSDRTVLRSARVMGYSLWLTLVSKPGVPVADALAELTTALATNDVTVQPVGELFAFAARSPEVKSLADIPPPPFNAGGERKGDIHARTLDLQQADVTIVLELYEILANRCVLRDPAAPLFSKVTVRNATPLTRAEGIWMLEALFRLHALVVVPHGEKLAVMTIPSRINQVPPFDPRNLVLDALGATNKMLRINSLTPGELLEFFCKLTGREPGTVAPNVSGMRIDFQSRTPLSRGETIDAVETLAKLYGLAFVVGPDRKVGLLPRIDAERRAVRSQP